MAIGILKAAALLAATTFIPLLELRASIPLGIFNGDIRAALGVPLVVATCLVTNVILGMAVFEVMAVAEHVLLKVEWFRRKVWPMLERRRDKLRPLVERYGIWGVSLFIGVPLPGTGACAGAIASYLLRLERRRFWVANLLGVLCAAIAVTAVCLAIDQGFIGEDSLVNRIFLKR